MCAIAIVAKLPHFHPEDVDGRERTLDSAPERWKRESSGKVVVELHSC